MNYVRKTAKIKCSQLKARDSLSESFSLAPLTRKACNLDISKKIFLPKRLDQVITSLLIRKRKSRAFQNGKMIRLKDSIAIRL